MNKIFLLILAAFLISCNPFSEENVLDYKNELTELVAKLDKYGDGTYDSDSIDEFEIEEVRALDIDVVVKNIEKKNPTYAGFIEENDSLVIFIRSSRSLVDIEKRIIYDFSTYPRNFGSETINGASYKIVQLDERWYYSEIGFD